jgi:hypothetical protein
MRRLLCSLVFSTCLSLSGLSWTQDIPLIDNYTYVDAVCGLCIMQSGDILVTAYYVTTDYDDQGCEFVCGGGCALFRFNPSGELLWFRLLSNGINSPVYRLIATNDDGYILSGAGALVKYDAQDCLVWENPLGSYRYLCLAADSGVISGYRGSDATICYVQKNSATGEIEWQRQYQISNSTPDSYVPCFSIASTTDGGCIIGTGSCVDGTMHPVFLKISADGSLEYTQLLDPGRGAVSVIGGPDGTFGFVASMAYNHCRTGCCGAMGNVVYSHDTYGDEHYFVTGDITSLPDQSFGAWVAGDGFPELSIHFFDPSGQLNIIPVSGLYCFEWPVFDHAVVPTTDGCFVIGVRTRIVKTDSLFSTPPTGIDDPGAYSPSPNLLTAYPNPSRGVISLRLASSNSSLPVSVDIYNLRGQKIRELTHGQTPAPACDIKWDGYDSLGRPTPDGVYLCRVTQGQSGEWIRVVRIR